MKKLSARRLVCPSLLLLKKFAPSNTLPVWAQWVLGILLLNALALCAAHYFQFRSLWLDEAFVAVNVRERSLLGLFSAYDYGQQFPRLYLSLIWVLQWLLGYEYWVLRLLPFVFGLAAVVLWSSLLIEEFSQSRYRVLMVCAVLLFLSNHFLYHFAGEFKQFSWDLFFSGFAVWIMKKHLVPAFQKSFSHWAGVALLAAFPILLSWSYTFVLFALTVSYFFSEMISFQRASWTRLGTFALFCLGFFAVSWKIDLIHSQYQGLTSYWSDYFIRTESLGAWLQTTWAGANRIIGRWWIEKITPGMTLLACFGFLSLAGHLIRKKPTPPLLRATVVLFLLLIALATAQKYPLYYGRTALFFFPFAVITIAHGIRYLIESKWKICHWSGLVAVAVVLLLTGLWKIPKVSKAYYAFQHFENINPAVRALDAAHSKLVVYGSGTEAQVRAFPNIPSDFTYVHLKEVDLDQLEDRFYFLVATPVGELAPLTKDLEARGYQRSAVTPKHLYTFKNSKI